MYTYIQLSTGVWLMLITYKDYCKDKDIPLFLEINFPNAKEILTKLEKGYAVYLYKDGTIKMPTSDIIIINKAYSPNFPKETGYGLTGILDSKGIFYSCEYKGHYTLLSEKTKLKEDPNVIHMSSPPYTNEEGVLDIERHGSVTDAQKEWFNAYAKYLTSNQQRMLNFILDI